ncbi:MAG: hypothetical protein AAFX56_11150 [Pseudomonadota bacterium]
MNQSTEDQIAASLVGILADGLNRSLNALEDAGAIDTTVLRSNYKPGSEYYALVTAALEQTAKYARPSIRKIIEESSTASD